MLLILLLSAVVYPQDSWSGPKNEHLTVIAQEIADAQKMSYTVTVFTPERWRNDSVVNAKIYLEDKYVTIYVSPLLAEGMDSEAIRALLAHELGHLQSDCGPNYASEGDQLECEGRADAFSARAVSRRAAIKGLCQMISIGWEYRDLTDATDLYARIKKLHYRTDIP